MKGVRPGGRQKGTPNKATRDAREAIAAFVEGNVKRLNGWLDQIAKNDPEAAFKAFMSVVEYHIPKLERREHTGKDGEEIQANLRVTFDSGQQRGGTDPVPGEASVPVRSR